MVCRPEDDLEDIKEEVISDLEEMLQSVQKVPRGVYVQASTLGSRASPRVHPYYAEFLVMGCI